jgi:truncated hemoglobin YjbI
MPWLRRMAGAGLLLASSLSLAQTPYTDDAVYRGLGGQQGIARIVDSLFEITLADPRIKETFDGFDIPVVKERLAEQICEFAGGPCKYTGKYKERDMKTVHEDLKLNDMHFNALAEDLQIAMERNNVPTSVSNKLIAKLAPMQRDIVTAGADASPPQRSPDRGKFIGTGGVSTVEGSAGGGIVPWALIAGYGTRDSWGATAFATRVTTQDYQLASYGAAIGIGDRVEVSLARQDFQGDLAPLDQLRIRQDIVGVKLRLAGDAVYEQDNWIPQIAAGLQYKKNKGVGGLRGLGVAHVKQLGASSDRGADFYVAATKIWFEQSLLLNGTLRSTRANQMGILGFGGDREGSRKLMPELSVGYLLTRKLVLGAEYRRKPHNLGVDQEKAYKDIFLAWVANRRFSLTAAYADLGTVTVFNQRTQRGAYVSAQLGF